jgi:hypothetical protein
MNTGVTAFSGRRGRRTRRAAAALLTGFVAAPLAVGATAAPAGAWGDDSAGVTMKLSSRTVDELTDGRNFVTATGRAEKHAFGDSLVLTFPLRSGTRESHLETIGLAGGVSYTGAGPDVTWTRLRINFETDRITGRVNGGDRVALLKVGDGTQRETWGDTDRSLRLTAAGARSLNRAAAGAPFSAGDVFAGDSSGCSG